MAERIGMLLPRSTDYPSMGFDILDGLRCGLAWCRANNIEFITDNIGFGENHQSTYAKAERMLLQEGVKLIICYSSAGNAEQLYGLAESSGCIFLFLDAGMQLPVAKPSPLCYHISLQGLHACRLAGNSAGKKGNKALIATSFYDGGYRGPWGYHSSIQQAGGSVCGNYVSGYKVTEFSISPYLEMLQHSGADCVAACFSSYLAELFIKSLKDAGKEAVALPFYCSPFMAEEQLLAKCDFPGGDFHAFVPWASSLENKEQQVLTNYLMSEKSKPVNIFHLLGWEAGVAATWCIKKKGPSMKQWSYKSPRGLVTIHPDTHYTYAPLYYGNIVAGENNKCVFKLQHSIQVDADTHRQYLSDDDRTIASGWKNNYFCI